MLSKKRRRQEPPSAHPRNRYAEKPPDFSLLASLYPSFQPFVFTSKAGRPAIDWTDYNATRELTRVLLRHDHGVQWWIPDGQLCPTVPNRSNYIHWIGDLIASNLIPKRGYDAIVRGFDIGTGANCIYPLLGASLYSWSFVGSDIMDIALESARKNVENNPHISHLIDIRNANEELCSVEVGVQNKETVKAEDRRAELLSEDAAGLNTATKYSGPPILVGVVREGEEFDFCMCNPPFFQSVEESGLNPKTSCGGTHQEMVCPGGERAFILRIIEDSIVLRCRFRWFTSMIGRKTNVKFLVSKLRETGASIVKTTEFVQGKTARWGLAWSFASPNRKSMMLHPPEKSNYTFMLELHVLVLQVTYLPIGPSSISQAFTGQMDQPSDHTHGFKRQNSAIQILKAIESFFLAHNASCRSDLSTFSLTVTISSQQIPALTNEKFCDSDLAHTGSDSIQCSSNDLYFQFLVFEQIPRTLLVKGSLLRKECPLSGTFSSIVQQLEEALRREFTVKAHV